MKKITLKISAFLFLAMSAFQSQAQVTEIVEGTKYNLRNAGTGMYLKATGTGAYEVAADLVEGEVTFNFFFNHHNTTDPGADGTVGTDDDVVHNYVEDWNIGNDTRGILRSSNTGLVHTNFKFDIWNGNGGHKTDKRWITTATDLGGITGFRIAAVVSGDVDTRYLYEIGGVPSNITEADMGADTGNSYWVLTEATTTLLSTKSFGVDAFAISNPVNNQLTIKGATSKVSKISLYSVLGNKVLSKVISGGNAEIKFDVSALSTGLYILEMSGNNGERFTKKIVKQ